MSGTDVIEPAAWGVWLGERAREQVRQVLSVDVDAERMMSVLHELRPRFESGAGVRLSVTDFVVRATTLMALENPELLAGLSTSNDEAGLDIGLVVQAEDGQPGVVTIEDAQSRTLVQLAGEREEARRRGATGLADEVLLVSNLGPYGVDHFIPGAGPSAAPIVGVGAVRSRSGRQVSAWVSLSVDARFVSLVTAGRSLARLRELLERPSLLIV